jgi:uncharacterized protein YndB with AHSA1/START domain
MQITRSVVTTAPLDKVFTYLSDFENTTEWDPGTVDTRRVLGDGGVGTKYHNVSQFMGRKTELEYTVRALDQDRRFVLVGENKTVQATDTMTFEQTQTGTRVTYNADFAFKGVLGKVAPALSPVLGAAFKKLGDEAEKGLQQALDRL